MDHQASRRHFLRTSLALAAVVGNGLPLGMRAAHADGFAALNHPFLANIMLNGGPDMRHLLMPPFSAVTGSYGREFWRTRASRNSRRNFSAPRPRSSTKPKSPRSKPTRVKGSPPRFAIR